MADAKRLEALGMPTPLAVEAATQIAAAAGGGSVAWADVTGKPTTFAPITGTAANQAMPGNTAIPVASSTAPAALAAAAAVGTGATFARADHVHAIPAASNGTTRGTVLRAAAQADSVAADVAALVTDFNALLAKLRTAGVIAT